MRIFLARSVVKDCFSTDASADHFIKGTLKVDKNSYWFSREEFEAIMLMLASSTHGIIQNRLKPEN